MDTITRMFSSVARNERGDGWLELSYDDAIRAVIRLGPPIAAPAAGSPLGEPAAGVLRLQGTGITSLTCTDPDCTRGVPPVKQAPEQVQFWMELQATAAVEAIDSGSSCLMVRGSGAQIAIPIFDAAVGTDRVLCNEMKKYRRVPSLRCVAFHVYLITVAPAPLAALQNKRIALPIPSELVAAAGGEWMRSSA